MLTAKQLRRAKKGQDFIVIPAEFIDPLTKENVMAHGRLVDTIEKRLDEGFVQPMVTVPAIWYEDILVTKELHHHRTNL